MVPLCSILNVKHQVSRPSFFVDFVAIYIYLPSTNGWENTIAVHIPLEVIGPAQWDEDVLGIYWTLVMGSAASEKHEKEERTEAHEAWESRSHMKPPD